MRVVRLGTTGNFWRRYPLQSFYCVVLLVTVGVGWSFGFRAGYGFYLGGAVLACAAAYRVERDILRASLRRKSGLCVSCGYDLRGQRFRCPECGRWIDGVPDPGEL
jgi:hypothetical protein